MDVPEQMDVPVQMDVPELMDAPARMDAPEAPYDLVVMAGRTPPEIALRRRS
jgi:hypothetical protein